MGMCGRGCVRDLGNGLAVASERDHLVDLIQDSDTCAIHPGQMVFLGRLLVLVMFEDVGEIGGRGRGLNKPHWGAVLYV